MFPPKIKTQPVDGANLDAFGKQRVSNATTLWDSKNIHSKYSDLWNEVTNGGATIDHLSNESAVGLTVGVASGDYAIRSTRRYFAYASGNSHQFVQTFAFPSAQTNLVVEAGYYDGPMDPAGAAWGNGLFIRQSGSTVSLVIRSDVNENPLGSRAVNETVIDQSTWSIDKLDGTGPSGITLDLTKTNIIGVDFQWLGVGRVRFNFDINGVFVPIHESNHANILTAVYIRTPTLPMRYAIWNNGVTTGATLKEICNTVKSEAQYTIPGIEYSVDTGGPSPRGAGSGIDGRLTVGTTEVPVLMLRLSNNINGMKNRKLIRFLEGNFSSQSHGCLFRLAHVHDVTSFDAYWYPVDGTQAIPGDDADLTNAESGAIYAYQNAAQTGLPTFTGGEVHFTKPRYVASGQGGRATGETADVTFINNHSYIANEFDATSSEVFIIYAQGEAANTDIYAAMDFIEFE